jgi:hypothetical protein
MQIIEVTSPVITQSKEIARVVPQANYRACFSWAGQLQVVGAGPSAFPYFWRPTSPAEALH